MYPIDRVSEPKEAGKTRVPLDAASDMLGLGIVFPGSISEGASFVSVMLTTHTPEDLDEMEALGMYEVAPEDFALTEFVCVSKQPHQKIIREGLDLMIKEIG